MNLARFISLQMLMAVVYSTPSANLSAATTSDPCWGWETTGGQLRARGPRGFSAVDGCAGTHTLRLGVSLSDQPSSSTAPSSLPDPSQVPAELAQLPRWLTWFYTTDGKKIPRQRVNDPGSWLTLTEALKEAAEKKSAGIGFVFTDQDDLGGIDLDACRDPETGTLEPWAQQIISMFDSYTEVSPSGTGVKIFAKGAPPNLPGHVVPIQAPQHGDKTPHLEAYVAGRYFTFTGLALPGADPSLPLAIRPAAWLKVVELLSALSVSTGTGRPTEDGKPADGPKKILHGGRNHALTQLAGLLRRKGMSLEGMLPALLAENQRVCVPPLPDNEVQSIVRSVARYAPTDDTGSPFGGKIPPNSQHHVMMAFDRLNVALAYDTFNERPVITYPKSLFGGEEDGSLLTEPFGEEHLRRLYFVLERDFFVKTNMLILEHLILDRCQDRPYNPVIDYFNTLKWDGVPRLDTWLETYLGVVPADERIKSYVQAVGANTLRGAYRRVTHPGCKFDSMLTLEGLQEAGKSMSIQMLVPNDSWVLEDLSLGTDAKVVIERATGKFLIEVSELVVSRKSDINRIKSFLSLRTDVARKAYGRKTTQKPRSFIFIATTNETHYLEDKTGNRRYWPVKCTEIDLEGLRRDRDQLWAEVQHLEKKNPNFKLYLEGELKKIAAEQVGQREAVDDWEDFFHNLLGEKTGWVRSETLWRHLGQPLARVNSPDSRRLAFILGRLGFVTATRHFSALQRTYRVWARFNGEPPDLGVLDAILDNDQRWGRGEREVPMEGEMFT